MLLLKVAVIKNPKNKFDKTPLYIGAKFNQIEVIRYLAVHTGRKDLVDFLNSEEFTDEMKSISEEYLGWVHL